MAFELLKEIESWLDNPVGDSLSPLADRGELVSLLTKADDSDLSVVIGWLNDEIEKMRADDLPRRLRARYALAEVERRGGYLTEAGKGFLELARAMVDLDEWEDVRQLALQGLDVKPDHRFVRLLLKAWAHLPSSDRLQEDVEYALRILPDDPALLFHESRRLDNAGDREEATVLACRAFAGFVYHKELEEAEEALFRALEDDSARTVRALLQTIPLLARQGAAELLEALVEFCAPLAEKLDLHSELAAGLEIALSSSDEYASLRAAFVKSLLRSLQDEGDLEIFVQKSGLSEPAAPFGIALKEFRRFCRLRPGTVVQHRSWGIGQVKKNDGEVVIADFESRPGHRMSFEMAETALVPLPPDSIRSLLLTHPEILREEKENDPVALVARALREHSRALSTREIKAALTPDVVGEGEWSGWWSRTRKLLEQDPRIDHTRAFEQVYALARDERVSEVDLPTLNLANLRRCVTTIKRFLKQHPQMRERAVRQYGPPLAGEAEQAIGDELLAVLPTLAEWYPERLTDWLRLAEKGYHTGGKTTSATTPDEQERLLRLGLEGSAAKLAAFTALPSRFATVRKAALSALADSEQEWDEQTLRVISEYPSHTKEGVALIQALLNEEGGNRFSDPWHGIVSVVRLLAGKTGAEADAVLDELLSPTGSLANRLRNRACPAGVLEQIRALILSGELRFEELRRLESFFASVGQSELAHQISAQLCAAKAADAGGELPPLDMEFTYMTRAAFEVAKRRLEEMERELRRDLPAAIQKARELGDLSENAEYHAARERQGIVSSQLVALREKLLHAKCIEELQIPEGYAWPGTEVVLEDGKEGTRRTYWLLGEGDEFHGPEVISYASPVGQALLGKKEGEQVEVQEGDHRRRFRIASVKRRLPAAQE